MRRAGWAGCFLAPLSLFVVLLATPAALGASYVADPQTYLSILPKLQSGDTLSLRPGYYRDGLQLRDLHGTPSRRIVIQGPRTGDAAILVARPGANTVSFVDTSYLTVRNFRIDGAHLAVDAIKAEAQSGPVHHITLEKLTIVNYDYAQDIIGISTKCPAWGWIIRDNDIIGAGTGLYLGNSDGTAPFIGGLIENNLIVDTIGYNIEIKHQINRPVLLDAPTGPSVTILRHNVFAKTRNASFGAAARPNVLVGHFPLQGYGASDRYDIVENIFFDNPSEALFQGEGNLTLARNLIFNPDGDAVAVQPQNDLPRRVLVVDNFVASAKRGIIVRGGDPGSERKIVRNSVFAPEPILDGTQVENTLGTLTQMPAALAQWLVRPSEQGTDDRAFHSHLAAFTRRACALTADATFDNRLASAASQRHPLCVFLRKLSSA
jgi:hypothetical protein